jgi:hypothetical protein
MADDQIDHPDHYCAGNFEAIDVIESYSLNFNTGNAVKYLLRAGKKPGSSRLTDLCKCRWYIDREIGRTETPVERVFRAIKSELERARSLHGQFVYITDCV